MVCCVGCRCIEALAQEAEDGERTRDRSLVNNLDALLWRVVRMIDYSQAAA
ncbi:MAG: hypothetical protein HQL74_13715 [Magnetococcales bacterium]|nr:hypothetical protein [Magnetococcales bacterium]